MRYVPLFLAVIFLQVTILHGIFKPGFLAPDLLLVLLLSRACLIGRDAVLWAALGGSLLDALTDTLGLNLSLYVLSVYLFLLVYEKFLFRNLLIFVLPSSVVLFMKKLLALMMMRSKFSFEVSYQSFLLSWFIEILTVLGLYFIYFRNRE